MKNASCGLLAGLFGCCAGGFGVGSAFVHNIWFLGAYAISIVLSAFFAERADYLSKARNNS